jgi:transcriptional regulator with XRE-family HTH domain
MNNLNRYRTQVKLTQSELASLSGITQQQISNLETGNRLADRQSLEDCRALVAALSAAGAVNESGEQVMLDDVFPPSTEEIQKQDTAA